jgi:23S rRNA pseudouridine1911/1915/1917 synthase
VETPRIIAETPEYLVLDKPAGLICHSDGRTVEPSVAEWLAEHHPETREVGEPWVSPQGESIRICGLAQRLDRTTSGVLVAARTQSAWEYLRGEFTARRVEKEYFAIVYGHVAGEQGRIVAEIMRSGEKPKRWYARDCEESDIRAAITEWQVLSRDVSPAGDPYSRMALFPKTGRTHQLRVHLAHIGHPIVADHLYAKERAPILGLSRTALHASAISFARESGEKVRYEVPLPADFKAAIE